MLKTLGKFIFMIQLGFKYIAIFKKTFFHPFISLKPAYTQLSIDRQNYSKQVLQFLNIELKIIGSLPSHNRVLYAINHRSLLDIIIMENVFSKNNKSGSWIAKQELLDSLIYGKFFEYSGCISVDLENKKGLLSFFKNIKKTFKKVDTMNLYMFPEGERFKGDGIHSFQSGAAKIAKANKLTVAPVYINGKMEAVFENAPYKETFTVEVHIGNSISHENLENEYNTFYNEIKKAY
ncbi:lysophospholipid acyltransferase family protein [Sulfurimonas sp.]|jgi:1-acyl-sn-glycerol-3-phosphate acyltransferase|uniref:lysophospholipid acyltransferase family protein n=1 Tax=Sulfurimonas sp. TaxID=2022749 RepID=UPI0025FD00A0|nr:lysophospholipid acyltransferase family protein [Sulfurimonas sp.]MBT5934445.1 1-acyl-sn-glycerol-3-phosphate acyltransferase [Sulfurimonas sp.]